MDLKYLKEELLPLRQSEIEEGKNAMTRQPIYVVLSLEEHFTSGHTDYYLATNYRGKPDEYGYIDYDTDFEDIAFSKVNWGMKNPIEITRFYTDRIIAFFLTSKGAHDYLEYQSHNLSDPYVYVFYSGYGNREMDKLFRV